MKTTNTSLPNYYKVSEVDLIYKSEIPASERPKMGDARTCVNILRPLFGDSIEHRESFWVLFLSRANKFLGAYEVGRGGVAGCVADPKLVFHAALKANASGIIISHNHPSGNLQASAADLSLTKKIKDGGRLLEIEVLDHIILTPESFMSFANDGLM